MGDLILSAAKVREKLAADFFVNVQAAAPMSFEGLYAMVSNDPRCQSRARKQPLVAGLQRERGEAIRDSLQKGRISIVPFKLLLLLLDVYSRSLSHLLRGNLSGT